ncbi:MAG: SdpI family protein [archaeon]
MDIRPAHVSICIIIVVSFVIGGFAFFHLPDQTVSHWDMRGNPNGTMSKFWGAFLMPIIAVALFIVFLLLPLIDPKRKNIKKFQTFFDRFILLIILFIFYIYTLSLLWNFGIAVNIGKVMIPAFAVLFFYAGVLIEHAEQNWSIGIRTPWTLSSTHVWKKTHILSGKLFKLAAIISLGGLFFASAAFFFVLIPVLLAAGISVIYSYVLFAKK